MGAATVVTTAAAGGQVVGKVKELCGTLGELMDRVNDCKDMNITSLTAYAKKTLITSRVYVEDQLASEDVTYKLIKLLNSIYSGFVMCAMGLNNLFVGGRTVRDMLNPIATETFQKFNDIIAAGFGDKEPVKPALESNNVEPTTPGDMNPSKGSDPHVISSIDQKNLEASSAQLFCGRLLEMHIPLPDKRVIPLYFYVQLLPKVIPQIVMSEFLRANISPSLKYRWAMWKAGELSFFKDFVFEADRVARRQKAIRADKDGILREIEDHRNKMLKKKMANFKTKEAYARQRNLCNSIVVCTKRTIDAVTREIGVNLKSFTQRNELMDDLFAVILAVVDTNYGTVDLYLNGIESRGEYTAKAIDAATKSGKELDTKELLALISAGSMPRF